MRWLIARLNEIDGKAMIPIFVALIALGGTLLVNRKQKDDHETNDQRLISTLLMNYTMQQSIDSLRISDRENKRLIRRLRIQRGRGSRIVAWPDTIFYGPHPKPAGKGTLLKALRKLWPF